MPVPVYDVWIWIAYSYRLVMMIHLVGRLFGKTDELSPIFPIVCDHPRGLGAFKHQRRHTRQSHIQGNSGRSRPLRTKSPHIDASRGISIAFRSLVTLIRSSHKKTRLVWRAYRHLLKLLPPALDLLSMKNTVLTSIRRRKKKRHRWAEPSGMVELWVHEKLGIMPARKKKKKCAQP